MARLSTGKPQRTSKNEPLWDLEKLPPLPLQKAREITPKIRSGVGFRHFAFFGNVCTHGTSLSLTDDQLAFFCSWVNLFVGKIIFKHQKTLENSSRNDKTVNISIEKRLYFPQLGRDVPGTLGTKISL